MFVDPVTYLHQLSHTYTSHNSQAIKNLKQSRIFVSICLSVVVYSLFIYQRSYLCIIICVRGCLNVKLRLFMKGHALGHEIVYLHSFYGIAKIHDSADFRRIRNLKTDSLSHYSIFFSLFFFYPISIYFYIDRYV